MGASGRMLERPAGRWLAERLDRRLSAGRARSTPFTTIAWRMLHVSDGNTIYWEHAFGPARRQFPDLAPHGDAAGAIAYLAESQRPVTAIVAEIDDGGLDELRPTPSAERWPAGRVLAVLLDEQLHHGAEIALLRDLYPRSHADRPAEVTTERRDRTTARHASLRVPNGISSLAARRARA